MTQEQITNYSNQAFRANLLEIDQWLQRDRGAARGMTLIMAQVNVVVKRSDGSTVIVGRTIAFINSAKRTDAKFIAQFTDREIPLLQATEGAGSKGEGHAEGAAAGLRQAGEDEQKAILGGVMADVNTALVSSRVCSKDCSKDLTTFAGNGMVTAPGSNGFLAGLPLDPPVLQLMRNSMGSAAKGLTAFDVMTHFVAQPITAMTQLDAGGLKDPSLKMSIGASSGGLSGEGEEDH